jgi:chromosome segregation ATPase
MSNNIATGIQFDSNGAVLVKDMQRAERAVQDFGGAANDAAVKTANLNNQVKQHADKLNQTRKLQESSTQSVQKMNGRLRDARGRFVTANDEIGKYNTKVKKATRANQQMGAASNQLVSKLTALAASVLSVHAAWQTLSGVVDVARRFEILEASLETATGSADNAQKTFSAINAIASTTPFSVEELTTAFIKLTNLGLDPSQDALRSYMNTASAMGKSLDQFIEAVADASVAEFERLKEFGIKAKNQGDTIAFTFRGTTKEVANNSQAIVGYLQDIGNVEFAGAMARRAQTLDGVISNLGDSYDTLRFTISEAGLGRLIAEHMQVAGSAMDDLTNAIASGEFVARINALSSMWADWANQVSGHIAT